MAFVCIYYRQDKEIGFILLVLEVVQSHLGVATHTMVQMFEANTDPHLGVQNSSHSAAHASMIYTIAFTLGTGDPAFSGVQPAWEEGTILKPIPCFLILPVERSRCPQKYPEWDLFLSK